MDHSQPFTPSASVSAAPVRNPPPSAREPRKKERMLEVSVIGAINLSESPLSAAEKGLGLASVPHTRRVYATVTVGRIRKKTNDSKLGSNPVWNSKVLLDVDEHSFDVEGAPAASAADQDEFCAVQIWRHVPVQGDENGEEVSIGKLILSRQDVSRLAKDRSLAWYPLIIKTEVEGCCSLDSCLKPKATFSDTSPQVRLGFRWAWRDVSRARQSVSNTPIHITVHPLGAGFGSLRPPAPNAQKKEKDWGRETYTRIPASSQTSDFVAEHEEISVRTHPSSARACLEFDVDEKGSSKKKEETDENGWVEDLLSQIGETLGLLSPETGKTHAQGKISSTASDTSQKSTPRQPARGVYYDFTKDVDQCCTCVARPRMEETVVVVERRVGVGINLISSDRGDLVVAGIQKAGPAGRSGQVQLGDVLIAVDGGSVAELLPERGIEVSAGMDWDSVLLGSEGESVELTFKRYDVASLTSAEANGSHSIHRVLLSRGKSELPSASAAVTTGGGFGSSSNAHTARTQDRASGLPPPHSARGILRNGREPEVQLL